MKFKILIVIMSIRAFTTTLVSFAIAYSGWSHVVISILETGTSIRQPQLANLQNMHNADIPETTIVFKFVSCD